MDVAIRATGAASVTMFGVTVLATLGLGSPARGAPAPLESAVPTSSPTQIIGGRATVVGQYPTVVVLTIADNLCTGTLVAPTWVLTAGHCVDPGSLGLPSQDAVTANAQVHFNTVDLASSAGRTIGASATFKDPGFNRTQLGSNDIGLIQLATPVTDIAPSPINHSAAMAPAHTIVTIVGYGATEHGAQGSIGVEYELPGRASVSCFTLGIGLDTNLMCFSQVDNHGTCNGDSGGPAFAMIAGRQTVVGVTSFGDMQCSEWGADTRVDVEQAFLMAHAPELRGCLVDQDCPSHRICFSHTCIAEPFGPGGLGRACSTARDCDSSMCGVRGEDKRCSLTCDPSESEACPDGFDCTKSGSFGTAQCWPATSGGCRVDDGGEVSTAVLGLGVILLGRRRKRRSTPDA